MARLLSGKVKVTPYAGLSTDRYEFIQLSETEPNAGLPGVDGYVLASDTSGNRFWRSAPGASAINGLTIKDDGSVVGTADSVSSLNFVGNNVVATASGFGATITVSDTPTLTSLVVSGISTFTNGPIFVGTANSTGTSSQPLQVTGGAYVSGNLGIGDTNPDVKFHVNSGGANYVAKFESTDADAVLLLSDNTTSGDGILVKRSGSELLYYGGTADTEVFRIDDDQNIGINSTAPKAKLDVNGTLNVSGVSTFGGNVYLGDNDSLRLGDNSDLLLLHNGSNSFVDDNGVGSLFLRSSVGGVFITKTNGDVMGGFNPDSSVELYHNAVKKFETTGAGVTITGIATAATFYAEAGTYAAGTDTETDAAIVIEEEGSIYTKDGDYLRNLIEKKSDIIIIGQQNTSFIDGIQLKPGVDGSVKLHAGGTTDNVKLETTGYGVSVTGTTDTDGLIVSGVSTFQSNVDFIDDARLRFGDGQDLSIWHNSSNNNSVIQESGSGDLNILANDLNIRNQAGNETLARFVQDGGVNLNYDNVKKLETTGYGVTIVGTSETQELLVTGIATISGLQYPTSDGTTGQVLKTDGSGVLSFVDTAGSDEHILPVMTRTAQANSKNDAVMVTILAGINTVTGRFGTNVNVTENGLVPFRETVGITTHSLIETFFNTVA